jgi:AcrR family transcriptional regulator
MARTKGPRLSSVARQKTKPSSGRAETEAAFLDAAERLLIDVGYAGITTRRLAEEAGANAGLVHYYFGSMEEVFVRALERFTDRLIERQQAMYAAEIPFIEKWRTAMRYLDEDLAAGYPKVWHELQALGWNRPDIRDRVARVNGDWREVLREAFGRALDDYGLDPDEYPLEAIVSLVMTFNVGIELERLSGITDGHRELLEWVDGWLQRLEDAKQDKDVRRPAD